MKSGHNYHQLAAIQATADLALKGVELQAIAQGILSCAMAYGKFDLGIVRLFDSVTQTLEPIADAGFDDATNVSMHRRKLVDTTTGRTAVRAIDARETQVIRGLAKRNRMRTLQRERAHTVVVVPIGVEKQTLGVLTLAMRTPCVPSREELVVLETMGNHLGIALQKSRLQEQLTRQALYDQLTGLANRTLLHDRLARALEVTRREGTSVAVLFVDLDRFKAVNDSLGHGAGDQVLVAVGERLSQCVRPADTVARLGGDEFAILLGSPSDLGTAKSVAARALRMLRRPLHVDGHTMTPSASLGLVVSSPDDTPDSLLEKSDVAMYDAKNTGGARVAAFRNAMRTGATRRVDFEARLAAAVRQNLFHLHYQPIVDVQSLAFVGVEALLRWDDPVEGAVSPSRFIPVLEANHLIRQVGRWVIQQSCRDAVTWQHPDAPLHVTVNVSAQQLTHRDFVSSVRSALDDAQLPSPLLVLEVTESMLVCNSAVVVKRLAQLRDLGIRIAVDDFGVGYSSLSYLRMFPVDILKIDKTFIEGVPGNPSDAALMAAIVDLGAALGLQVIAEGIEDSHQAQWLQTTRCSLAQGFHYAKPMPAEAIPAAVQLSQRRRRAAMGATPVGDRSASARSWNRAPS